MRLFIAIDLPENVLEQLQVLIQTIPAGRPARTDQLHLTMFFLGEVGPDVQENLEKELGRIHAERFSLGIHGVGCFPSPARPRILWAGVRDHPSLHQLKKKLDAALVPLGFVPDRRPFHPHLTLSRIKNPKTAGVAPWIQAHQDFQSDEWPVENFHLYSSLLTPKGAVYTKIQTYPLK